MVEKKHYADRDHMEQGQFYADHVGAMTTEGLHAKSDIAAELAHRDIQIRDLKREVEAAQRITLSVRNQAKHDKDKAATMYSRKLGELEALIVRLKNKAKPCKCKRGSL